MDKIARIRAELKRRREDILSKVEHRPIHRIELLDDLLSFLDTLSEEPDTPEFPETFEICLYDGRTPDNEKCTECSTTCSVRKEEPDKSLEEAAEEYTQKMLESWRFDSTGCRPPRESFIAGAEWQKEQDERVYREFFNERNQGDASFRDLLVYKEGHRDGMEEHKDQMMKDSVEGYVNYYEDSGGILMAEAQVGCPYHNGDKVRIIVLKEEE